MRSHGEAKRSITRGVDGFGHGTLTVEIIIDTSVVGRDRMMSVSDA